MIKCYPPRPRSFEGQKMTNCSTGKEAMRRKSDPSWHHERRSNSQKESYKNKNIGDFCIWSRFLQSWQKCSGNIFRMRKIIKGSWCSYCLYIDPPYLEQTFHGKLQKIWQFQRKNDLLASLLSDSKNIFKNDFSANTLITVSFPAFSNTLNSTILCSIVARLLSVKSNYECERINSLREKSFIHIWEIGKGGEKKVRGAFLWQENSLNWFGDGITDSPTVALHASGDPLTVVCERPPSSRAGASPLTSPLCPADDQPHTYTGPPTHNIDTGLTSLAETMLKL